MWVRVVTILEEKKHNLRMSCRCNDDTPDLPDTVPGGGSTFLTASLITLLGALLILN